MTQQAARRMAPSDPGDHQQTSVTPPPRAPVPRPPSEWGQLVAPEQLGPYTLLARLASGGMGEIFLARYRGAAGFERMVVVKRLLSHLADDDYFVSMFVNEARLAGQLRHPNLCEVTELGAIDEEYFLAMEYLDGLSMAEIMRAAMTTRTPLPVGLVVGVIMQACEGLHHAHDLQGDDGEPYGLVHRDVSPPNLLVTQAGIIKVLDFGIAKIEGSIKTQAGTLKGKASYMSPEQVRGDKLDRRSDIFALGTVLHEAITGVRLFRRATDVQTLYAVKDDPAPMMRGYRADVPPELETIVARALEKDRDRRWLTARELGDALGRTGLAFSFREISRFLHDSFRGRLTERRAFVAMLRSMPLGADDDDDAEDTVAQAPLTLGAGEGLASVGTDPTEFSDGAPRPPWEDGDGQYTSETVHDRPRAQAGMPPSRGMPADHGAAAAHGVAAHDVAAHDVIAAPAPHEAASGFAPAATHAPADAAFEQAPPAAAHASDYPGYYPPAAYYGQHPAAGYPQYGNPHAMAYAHGMAPHPTTWHHGGVAPGPEQWTERVPARFSLRALQPYRLQVLVGSALLMALVLALIIALS